MCNIIVCGLKDSFAQAAPRKNMLQRRKEQVSVIVYSETGRTLLRLTVGGFSPGP